MNKSTEYKLTQSVRRAIERKVLQWHKEWQKEAKELDAPVNQIGKRLRIRLPLDWQERSQ